MTIFPLSTCFNDFVRLTTPTKPYDFSAHTKKETEQLAKDIVESLYKYNGLGISANQLGMDYSIFAMRGDKEDYVCFNPTLAVPSLEVIKLEEGCLSFPGITLKINRPRHIRMRFSDINGQIDSFTYANLTARVIQHEMDHLNGELFFAGTSRFHLERALRQAKNKGYDYSQFGLMKYARK